MSVKDARYYSVKVVSLVLEDIEPVLRFRGGQYTVSTVVASERQQRLVEKLDKLFQQYLEANQEID